MSAPQTLVQKFIQWMLEQPYWWPFWLFVLLTAVAVVVIYVRIRQALGAIGFGNTSRNPAPRSYGTNPPRGMGDGRGELQRFSQGAYSPPDDHLLTNMGQTKPQVTAEKIAKALDIYCTATGAARDGNYAFDYKDPFTHRYVIISDMSRPINDDYLATIDLDANWGAGAIFKQAQHRGRRRPDTME